MQALQRELCFPHLKINPLQVCNEGNEEVGVVQLLCQLSHGFGLRLLVPCSTQNLLQRGQVLGHLLCNLSDMAHYVTSLPLF